MLFRRLCDVIGRPEVAADQRFATNALRTEHHAELQEELERALRNRTVDDWLARLEAADLPCGPINDVAAVLAHPQVRARNMVVAVDDERLERSRDGGQPDQEQPSPRRPDPRSRPGPR